MNGGLIPRGELWGWENGPEVFHENAPTFMADMVGKFGPWKADISDALAAFKAAERPLCQCEICTEHRKP